MRARRGAAFALVTLAFALGAVACGGSATKTTTTTARDRVHQTHWRAGLVHWRRTMLRALDGISVIFSTDASLKGLQRSHSEVAVRLERYESTLANCTQELKSLGAVPRPFAISDHYAGQACKNLEQGEKLVETAVAQIGRSTALDPLDQASVPLGVGQSELTTATRAMDVSPPPPE